MTKRVKWILIILAYVGPFMGISQETLMMCCLQDLPVMFALVVHMPYWDPSYS